MADETQGAIDDLLGQIDDVALDKDRWSHSQSIDLMEAVTEHCRGWVETLRAEEV